MRTINLNDKLFHSIGYIDEKSKEKLTSILQNGFIFTRQDMSQILGDDLTKKYITTTNNFNGLDYVSVTRKNKIHLFDYLYDNESNSYLKYVLMYYRLCLIINEKILNNMEFRKGHGQYNEIQIKGSIPFSYIDAIGVSLESTDLNRANLHYESMIIDSIKELLEIYKQNIPIIEINTGFELTKKIKLYKKTN